MHCNEDSSIVDWAVRSISNALYCRSSMKMKRRFLHVVTLYLLFSVGWTKGVTRTSLLSSRGGSSETQDDGNAIPFSDTLSKKWTSFFSVDPSKILSVLVKRGGLLIPRSVEKELLTLKSVLAVDEASLNLLEKMLLLRNFTVTVPGSNKESLRIGHVCVKWDSYLKPCVDIEMEEVNVSVEFTNLQLTRSNWNELEDKGFPPTLYGEYDESAPSSTFVRIGSVQLSGNITCEIGSRPLDRSIANMTVDMDTFEPLYRQIRTVSEENLASTGRRGCTTDELYTLIQSFFLEKMRKFIRAAAEDMAMGAMSEEGSHTIRDARKLLASAGKLAKTYAGDAGKKTRDNIEESIASRLDKFGVPSSREKLSTLRELSTKVARSIDVKSLAGSQVKRLREAYLKSSDVDDAALAYQTVVTDDNSEECRGAADHSGSSNRDTMKNKDMIKETIIIFPDW